MSKQPEGPHRPAEKHPQKPASDGSPRPVKATRNPFLRQPAGQPADSARPGKPGKHHPAGGAKGQPASESPAEKQSPAGDAKPGRGRPSKAQAAGKNQADGSQAEGSAAGSQGLRLRRLNQASQPGSQAGGNSEFNRDALAPAGKGLSLRRLNQPVDAPAQPASRSPADSGSAAPAKGKRGQPGEAPAQPGDKVSPSDGKTTPRHKGAGHHNPYQHGKAKAESQPAEGKQAGARPGDAPAAAEPSSARAGDKQIKAAVDQAARAGQAGVDVVKDSQAQVNESLPHNLEVAALVLDIVANASETLESAGLLSPVLEWTAIVTEYADVRAEDAQRGLQNAFQLGLDAAQLMAPGQLDQPITPADLEKTIHQYTHLNIAWEENTDRNPVADFRAEGMWKGLLLASVVVNQLSRSAETAYRKSLKESGLPAGQAEALFRENIHGLRQQVIGQLSQNFRARRQKRQQ